MCAACGGHAFREGWHDNFGLSGEGRVNSGFYNRAVTEKGRGGDLHFFFWFDGYNYPHCFTACFNCWGLVWSLGIVIGIVIGIVFDAPG